MVTDTEHIEALRKRLVEKQRDKEAEVREIQEMIRVLGDAPKVLLGRPGGKTESQEQSSAKPSARYNMNLSKQVDDYIAECKYDEVINIGAMIKTLKEEQGVKGKNSSLYAYIHSLLKKRADDKDNPVTYTKGAGFTKTRHSDITGKNDSELVATL